MLLETFFVIAIAYMVVQIIFWVGVIALLFIVYKKFVEIFNKVTTSIENVQNNIANTTQAAAQISTSFAQSFKRFFRLSA